MHIPLPNMLILADFLENIVGLLFVIFWVAAQFLGNRQEAKKRPKPPRPRPQQPPPVEMAGDVPPPQAAKPRNQEEALRNEVEEFLRRAQGKPPRPQPQPVRSEQPAVRKPQPPRPEPQQPKPIRREPVAPVKTPTMRNEGVAEHVARHMSTHESEARIKTLGAEVALSDDRLESRLHEKFDHQVGKLQHYDTPADGDGPAIDVAAEVAAMLRSPQGMRQLIIANEILRRPEW